MLAVVMSSNGPSSSSNQFPLPLSTTASPSTSEEPRRLLAAIDMGTSSFKLLVAEARTSRLLPLRRLSSPVHLGLDRDFDPPSLDRSLSALRSFSLYLSSLPQPPCVRTVATASLRLSPAASRHLLPLSPFPLHVLSGHDEARLSYLSSLSFLPSYHHRLLLSLDIGGGSTEIAIGRAGRLLFSASLPLGHVSLSRSFLLQSATPGSNLSGLRSHVRAVLQASGAVKGALEVGFEAAAGSSGTVRAAAAVIGGSDPVRRWRIEKAELEGLERSMCDGFEGFGFEGVRRLGFKRRRAQSALAGVVVLKEVFDAVGIEEMEVSGYALADGVMMEMMMEEGNGEEFDWCRTARWRAVVATAVRFGGEKSTEEAAESIVVAKVIFDGIRRCRVQIMNVWLVEKDFEYVEAALMLCNVGRMMGERGHHKHSYNIIKSCGYLHGYSSNEIELIALLARFHRKKFPTSEHVSLQELPVEIKNKFRFLCIITRLSLGLQQCPHVSSEGLEVVYTSEGLKLLLHGSKEPLSHSQGCLGTAADAEEALREELKRFKEVFSCSG